MKPLQVVLVPCAAAWLCCAKLIVYDQQRWVFDSRNLLNSARTAECIATCTFSSRIRQISVPTASTGDAHVRACARHWLMWHEHTASCSIKLSPAGAIRYEESPLHSFMSSRKAQVMNNYLQPFRLYCCAAQPHCCAAQPHCCACAAQVQDPMHVHRAYCAIQHTTTSIPWELPMLNRTCYSSTSLQQVQAVLLLCITPFPHNHRPSPSCQRLYLLLAILVTELEAN